jgi:PAS domain S-box-containing protein
MKGENPKQAGAYKQSRASTSSNYLHHLAFENSLQATLIITVSTGKIVTANAAACKLLGYTNEEVLTITKSAIFNIDENSFKKMLKQTIATGQSRAFVTVLQKNGQPISCNVTIAVFLDNAGVEEAVITIEDMSDSIKKQKNTDSKKEKLVADNIAIAALKQKVTDSENEKIVADNIVIAITTQKKIDRKKQKIVAQNITIAKSIQKDIDSENEKIYAGNIGLAKAKQRVKDARRKRIVAKNILFAKAKADAMLAKNNEWIEYIAKTSYDVMWDWDLITNQVYVGDSITEVFGYRVKKNTITFNDFTGCLLENEKDGVQQKLLTALASGTKSWNDSFSLRLFDGSVALTTCRASIVRGDSENAVRLIGAIHDVTRLQEIEKKLDEQIAIQEELSETFLMAAKLSFDGIWDWNLSTDDVVFGAGFEELFGYKIDNNTGNIITNWSDHLYPNDKKAVEKGLNTAIFSSATHWECGYRFLKADDTIAKVFTRASIIRDTKGKACRIIGAMQDITERKKNEAEKEVIINELLKSNADLKQFSYITSHNLRAPLSNIKSILTLIDYPSLNEANADLLKLLNDAGTQLSKTIDDLTNILIIKNNVNAVMHTACLPDAFYKLSKSFHYVLNEAKGKIETDFMVRDINFNETYLESIMINLFSNAIKYRSPDRTLIIKASSVNNEAGDTIFCFSDNGTGIDLKRYKDRLFGLYQRFHSDIEGSGLGLYIIKSQIEALNGNIEIESEPDKGTTFIITFKKQVREEDEHPSASGYMFPLSITDPFENFDPSFLSKESFTGNREKYAT